jgi:hypothetical protein
MEISIDLLGILLGFTMDEKWNELCKSFMVI